MQSRLQKWHHISQALSTRAFQVFHLPVLWVKIRVLLHGDGSKAWAKPRYKYPKLKAGLNLAN